MPASTPARPAAAAAQAHPSTTSNASVLTKLVIFSLLIAVVPIATYFSTLNSVWKGSTTWAAISAVLAANVVLVGYVVVAFKEDAADRKAAEGGLRDKKGQ